MGLLNPVTTVLPLRDSLQGRDRSGLFSATATGPVRYDDAGLIIEPGTTNYVPNPIGGVNGTGWVGSDANWERVRVDELPGPLPGWLAPITTGFRVTALADISGINTVMATTHTVNVAAAGDYTVMGLLWIPSEMNHVDLTVLAFSFSGSTAPFDANVDMGLRDQWQIVTNPLTVDAGDLNGQWGLQLRSGTITTGQHFYVTCCAIQPGSVPTSPAVGSMGPGYSWAGTPHGSASVRAATQATFDPDGRVDNDSFAMVGRFSLDSITDGWQAIASAGKQDIGNFFGVFNRDDGRFSAKSNGGYAEDSLTFTSGSLQIAYVAGKDTDWIGQLDDNTPIAETRSDGGAWSNSNVYIGSTNNGDYLNGSVGPIAFYDRPLTDVELDKVKAATSLGRNPWGLLAPKKQHSFFQLRPGV